MNGLKCLLGCTVVTAALSASPSVQSRTRAETVCASTTDRHAIGLLAGAREIISNPKLHGRRDELHLPMLDPALVQPVRSDSVCKLIGRAMRSTLRDPDSMTYVVYALKLDQLYWAEDTAVHGGEWLHVFILDSTATRVLVHSSR